MNKILVSLQQIFDAPSNRGQFGRTLLRLCWWKINQIFFKYSVVYPLTSKTKLYCRPSSSYAGLIIYQRFPEYPEMAFLEQIMLPSDICLDIGANIGGVTMLMAEPLTTGHVYAFEPAIECHPDFQNSVVLNHYESKVSLNPEVISDKNGKINFVIESHSEVNHLATSNTELGQVLPTITLDTFCKRHKLSQVDIVKIDVEGAEIKVLKGAIKLLQSQQIAVLVLELNSRGSLFGSSPSQTAAYLRMYGYQLFEPTNDGMLRTLGQIYEDRTVNIVAISKNGLRQKRFKSIMERR